MKIIISSSLINSLVAQAAGISAKIKAEHNSILHRNHPDMFKAEQLNSNKGEFPSFNNFPEVKNKFAQISKDSDNLVIDINDDFIEESMEASLNMYHKMCRPVMEIIKVGIDCSKKYDSIMNHWFEDKKAKFEFEYKSEETVNKSETKDNKKDPQIIGNWALEPDAYQNNAKFITHPVTNKEIELKDLAAIDLSNEFSDLMVYDHVIVKIIKAPNDTDLKDMSKSLGNTLPKSLIQAIRIMYDLPLFGNETE